MARKPMIYILGPTRGCKENNIHRFDKARERLEAAGYEVTIPHKVIRPENSDQFNLRLSIIAMLRCANGVALLEGQWFDSMAEIQKATAIDCGLPIKTVDKWVECAPRKAMV